MSRTGRSSLEKAVARLAQHYGPPPALITDDPFELILLESVAYLVSDERREEAFNLLRKLAGTKPHQIIASKEDLLRVAKLSRFAPEQRAARLREIALIATTEFGGDLRNALKLPHAKAKQALRKFPGIGEPGADKILLFTRTHPALALDSNGLRVLLRLGFGEGRKNY